MMLERLLTDPRITVRRSGPPDPDGRCVVYWMQRAQRGLDNPALDVAIKAANILQKPIIVFFGLHPPDPRANLRHYTFLAEGLAETAHRVRARGAGFAFGSHPQHELIRFCEEVRAGLVIGDENPLREPESWRQSAARRLRVPFWTVDADVIVPSREFQKEEYSARTLRPKLQRLLPVFLHPSENPVAEVRYQATPGCGWELIDSSRVLDDLPLDRRVQPVSGYPGGTAEAVRRLELFIRERLPHYDTTRHQPHLHGTSELSAHLHFGHIGPLTIALAVRNAAAPQSARDAYLEELIVRRELAVNFVARNRHYDTLAGCHEWARKTLDQESRTEREFIYSATQFEHAETHDPLWNAAQQEMVITGRMHGYLRMYWAKKILEWTRTPEEAFEIAVQLNDRYEMDGRDPNGYAGIAWAIGGKHDRPWGPRRPVFGLIRYMNAAGCARKFDVKAYIASINGLAN
jgi:deoxyribodipyrimidine photo-lyase